MDTSEYSFPYIASWSEGKQLEQLKNVLQEIQSAAKQISNAIDSELLKMQKRHLSIDEKLADTELNNVQKAEFLIEDCADRNVIFSTEDTEKIIDYAKNHGDISETAALVEDMEISQKQRDNYGYDFTYMNAFDSKEAALKRSTGAKRSIFFIPTTPREWLKPVKILKTSAVTLELRKSRKPP